ncbi:MAG: response regulator [Eubacteriales bacterium]|nr:response regulator [Eubacteriales bacterium]
MYKVIIVEDEERISKGLEFAFPWQEENCVVLGIANNGSEGLALIESLRPDIVISDINMPEMDGLQMLENSIVAYKYKAILISGYSEFSYAQRAIGLGVSEYLLKPLDFDSLKAALRKTIMKIEKYKNVEQAIAALPIQNGVLNTAEANNKYVVQMLQYIEEKYNNRISITDISEQTGVSCSYLNTKFKAETGYTFNDYLNRYRIQKAVEYINQNRYKIYEIAEKTGFTDYKYFIKVFKKYTGYAPSQMHTNEE